MYRIYTIVNYEDTGRHPNTLSYTEFGYTDDLEKAIEFVKKYIDENFLFPEKTVLYERNGFYSAHDLGSSWAETIVIEKQINCEEKSHE